MIVFDQDIQDISGIFIRSLKVGRESRENWTVNSVLSGHLRGSVMVRQGCAHVSMSSFTQASCDISFIRAFKTQYVHVKLQANQAGWLFIHKGFSARFLAASVHDEVVTHKMYQP